MARTMLLISVLLLMGLCPQARCDEDEPRSREGTTDR
jgi:hypothetical protein